ncbi:hypothetical protein NDI49_30815 [Trichocoleus sp. ST-U3]
MDLPIEPEIVELTEPSTIEQKKRLSELENKIRSAFYEAGLAFREIRQKRLYQLEGYNSFENYLKDKWRKSKSHANDLIKTAKIISEDLLPISSEKVPLPTTETQVRPLMSLEPEQRQELWRKVCETAPNGKITKNHVEKVKNELYPSNVYRLHEKTHTEIQWILAKLGCHLCGCVWLDRNDHSKSWEAETFSDLSIKALPPLGIGKRTENTIKYIDVLWLRSDNQIDAAFEIECSTSIYSGLLRMVDLVTLSPNLKTNLYIVVPESRVEQVKKELSRPAFNNDSLELHQKCRWIVIEELVKEWEGMMKYGSGSATINKIAHSLDGE